MKYRVLNLVKTGPVRLTGHMLPVKSIPALGGDEESYVDLSKDEFDRYAPCINALYKAGFVGVQKVDPDAQVDGATTDADINPPAPEGTPDGAPTPPADAENGADPGAAPEGGDTKPETPNLSGDQPAPEGDTPAEPAAAPVTDEEKGSVYSKDNLMAMKMDDLTPLATSLGINPSGMRKEGLVNAILEKTETK